MAYRAAGLPRIGHLDGPRDLPGISLFLLLFLALLISAPAARAGKTAVAPDLLIDPGKPRDSAVLPPGTGFIPPGIDLSHLAPPLAGRFLTLPSHFDWREAGGVTPVKNQGTCGSCYAFAAIAAMESRVLIVEDSTFDFSENNVKECEWYESSCNGGNDWIVANYLTTAGTVLEACDPYVPYDTECNQTCPYRKTLCGWGEISGNVIPSVEVLKSYVGTYGPIYTTMYAGSGDPWRSEFAAYGGGYTLYHAGSEYPNHAVLIVGWDDELPHAGGQGAWIVKNSWGSSWGGTCGYGTERGYFTIAYGSASIGAYSSIPLEWENYSADDTLLYYDEGGAGGRTGFVSGQTAWGLCKYTPARMLDVKRVEFWTIDAAADIDVYIYEDLVGGTPSGLLTSNLDNAFDLAGYHSVRLEPPLHVTAGQDIYVVVKVTAVTSNYPLSYDTGGPDQPGCCYLSADGSYFFPFTLGDLGIRLRAGTNSVGSEILEAPVILGVNDVEGDSGGYVTVTWRRSLYDAEGGDPLVKLYRVWRKRRESLPVLLGADDGHQIGGPYEHGLNGPAWEVVGTVSANGSHTYELTAPTQCDLSGSDTCWTYFCVTSHTGVPGTRFDSVVERGYSVNNGQTLLPPAGEDDDRYEADEGRAGGVVLRTPEPNPAVDGFLIEFELGRAQKVDLAVYDVTGRRVAELLAGTLGPGPHGIRWEPGSSGWPEVPAGLYFVSLEAARKVHTAKLILLK
jgi:C1A family cysteine protease